MKKRLAVILIVSCLTTHAEEWRARWEQSGGTWLEKWTNTLDSINDFQQTDQFEILGAGARTKRVQKGGPALNENQVLVGDRAISMLVNFPGHAEHYRDKILIAQQRYRDPGGGNSRSVYQSEMMYGFQILAQFRSPETIRVLGEMLGDDWIPSGEEKIVTVDRLVSLARNAAGTLKIMPIRDKPDKGANWESNLAAWRQWYGQVKAGTRTFRFEGDPTEYDLDGPASGEKLQRIEKSRKRDAERQAGIRRSSTDQAEGEDDSGSKTGGSPVWPGALAGIVVVLAAGWWFFRMKRLGE